MRIPTPWFPLLVLSAAIGYANPSFDFTYTFASTGDVFGGTFTGTWNGSLVTVDSITSVWVNDPSIKYDAIVTGGFDTTGALVPGAVMSATLVDNNFQLTDPDGFGTYLFSIAPDTVGDVTALGTDPSEYDSLGSTNSPQTAGNWTLTEVPPSSSVPDDGSPVALLVVSFAALGLLRKRR